MKCCCVIHQANESALDFILAASAFFDPVTVILVDQGLTLSQTKSFQVLKEYDIHPILIRESSKPQHLSDHLANCPFIFHF